MTQGVVVVGVDGSESSERALLWAADFAATTGSELVVALSRTHTAGSTHLAPHPVWPWPMITDTHQPDQAETHAALVASVEASLAEIGLPLVTYEVTEGPAADALLHIAKSRRADLLVVGRRGLGGFKRLMLGSVSDECARYATCPVAVVSKPDEADGRSGPIQVGFDGSELSKEAVTWAAGFASASDSELEIIHVWEPPGIPPDSIAAAFPQMLDNTDELEQLAQATLATALASVAHTHPEVSVVGRVVEGYGSAVLIREAHDAHARALVLGNRGFGGFASLLLGSVADQTLHHIDRPIVIVRPINHD